MNTHERIAHNIAKEVYAKDKDIGDIVMGISIRATQLEKFGIQNYFKDADHDSLKTAIHLRRIAYRLWSRFGDKR